MWGFMRTVFRVAVAAIAIVVSSSAFAAQVEPTQGEVLINRGSGFKTLQGPTTADAGDQVVANPGGGALITFADGCKITVEPGAVATIPATSPCKTLGFSGQDFAIAALVAGGVAGGVVLLNNDNDKPASP